MKNFAGVDLAALRVTSNIFTLQQHSHAILKYLHNHIKSMPCKTADDAKAKLELDSIVTQQIIVLPYLNNYSRLSDHLFRLDECTLEFPWRADSLNALIDLAAKCAPNVFKTKGELLAMDAACKQIDAEAKMTCDFEDASLKSAAIQAKKLYRAATEENLQRAFIGLNKVAHLSLNLKYACNLPFVVGLQLAYYLNILSELEAYTGADMRVISFAIRVRGELGQSISILENITDRAHGYLSSLTYRFYGKDSSANESTTSAQRFVRR